MVLHRPRRGPADNPRGAGTRIAVGAAVNVSLVYGTGTTTTTILPALVAFTGAGNITDSSPAFRGLFIPSGNNLCINKIRGGRGAGYLLRLSAGPMTMNRRFLTAGLVALSASVALAQTPPNVQTQTFGTYFNNLPPAAPLGPSDQVPVLQGGRMRKAPVSQITGGGGGAVSSLTRAQIPSNNLFGVSSIVLNGYNTANDAGFGAPYTCVGQSSTSTLAIRDNAGNWCALATNPVAYTKDGVQFGWFGADPTGAADSTAAMQAAIDFSFNNGINNIFCSKGKWKITYPLFDDPPYNIRGGAPYVRTGYSPGSIVSYQGQYWVALITTSSGSAPGHPAYVGTNLSTDFAYQTVNSTSSVNYNPSWSTSQGASGVVATFKGGGTIGTPNEIARVYYAGSGRAFQTEADAPAGSLIVLFIDAQTSPQTVTGVTLSSGDTVTQAVQSTATSGPNTVSIWYVSNSAHDLPKGGTITVTTSGGGNFVLVGVTVANANGGLDKTASLANTSGQTGVSIPTGTLRQANEIIFGGFQATTDADPGFTQATNFTTLNVGWANATWSSGTTYAQNAIVMYNGFPWVSLRNGNSNHIPQNDLGTGPLVWWQPAGTAVSQFSFGSAFHGPAQLQSGGGPSGCQITPTFNNTVALIGPPGNGNQIDNITINGPHSSSAQHHCAQPSTGAGLSIPGDGGGSNAMKMVNIVVANFYMGIVTGSGQGFWIFGGAIGVGSENFIYGPTILNACFGIANVNTQGFINSVYDPSIEANTGIITFDQVGMEVYGGEITSEGVGNPSTSFAISSVSNSGSTVTATINSAGDQYLAQTCTFTGSQLGTVTGSISGTTLTVTGTPGFTIGVGDVISGPGVTTYTTIVSGSGPTYTVSFSQSVPSTTLTFFNPASNFTPFNLSLIPTCGANVYNAWVINTPDYHLVPLIMTSYNSSTHVATFQFEDGWQGSSFGNTCCGGGQLQIEIQAATTIYASEMLRSFASAFIKVHGGHNESTGAPQMFVDTSQGFGGAQPSLVENVYFNYNPSLADLPNIGTNPQWTAAFYVQQIFPFIKVGNSLVLRGITAYLTDYNLIVGGQTCCGGGSGTLTVQNSQNNFKLFNFWSSTIGSSPNWNNTPYDTRYTATMGFGQWEQTPWQAANVYVAQYFNVSNYVESDLADRTTGFNGGPYEGVRPAPWTRPCLRPDQVATLQSLPTIIQGSGVGTPPPYIVAYPLLWSGQQYQLCAGSLTPVAYSAAVTYSQGDMVSSGGTTYFSLVNNNLNHTPASSPTQWGVFHYGLVSNHGVGFSYGQNLTTTNVPGLSWTVGYNSPFISVSDTGLLFPGLGLQLSPTNAACTGTTSDPLIIRGVHKTLGYIDVVGSIGSAGPAAGSHFLPNLNSGAQCTGTTITQQPYSFTNLN
jgi:hypothetical protein